MGKIVVVMSEIKDINGKGHVARIADNRYFDCERDVGSLRSG